MRMHGAYNIYVYVTISIQLCVYVFLHACLHVYMKVALPYVAFETVFVADLQVSKHK